MTIGGWILFGFVVVFVIAIALCVGIEIDRNIGWAISILISVSIIIGVFTGMKWYFNNTASGQRAIVDQKSEISSGLDRTVTVYTADGQVIAQYTGKIDIEGNDGGYVLFDFKGKRYTYYNCFVESIAEIG